MRYYRNYQPDRRCCPRHFFFQVIVFGYFKFHGKQQDTVNAMKISVDGSAEPLTPNLIKSS